MCFCRAHYLMLAVVVVLGVAGLLNACGAKGNLYLPQPGQEQAPNGQSAEPPTEPPSP